MLSPECRLEALVAEPEFADIESSTGDAKMCLQPVALIDTDFPPDRGSFLYMPLPEPCDIRRYCRLCIDPAARRVRAPRRAASARRRGSDASRDDGGGGDGDGPRPQAAASKRVLRGRIAL